MSNPLCTHHYAAGSQVTIPSLVGLCHRCNRFYRINLAIDLIYIEDAQWGTHLMHRFTILTDIHCPYCDLRFDAISMYCDRTHDPAQWWDRANQLAEEVEDAVDRFKLPDRH